MDVCEMQDCPSSCENKCQEQLLPDEPRNVSIFQSSVCRVCLSTEVRMYHMADNGLSDIYARVVGVQINAEDRLPRQLCWECVGRLSSSHRFILKASKTQTLLERKMNESGLITISDIESIDKAQHKLESTLVTKLNTVNEYDYHFTEETVKSNNYHEMNTSKSANNDCNEDISHIELDADNKQEGKFKIEEVMVEISPIKFEQVFEEETHSYNDNTDPDIHDEGYNDPKKLSDNLVTITIKQENASDEEVLGDDGSVIEMSQDERLSPLKRQRSKMPPGGKTSFDWDICSTEHASKQVIAHANRSTNHIPTNKKEIFTEIELEEDTGIISEVNLPRSVAEGASININRNTRTPQNIDKSKKFICDICNKRFYYKPALIKHIQKHPKMYYCSYCNYKAYERRRLQLHVNAIHIKNEFFQCPYCSYKAYTKRNLVKHVNSKHTKSVVFNCPHCSYEAYEKGNLLKHVNAKHTKSEVFNCPHCNYVAYQKGNLLRHINTKHTKSEVFNCTHCSYTAHRKWVLLRHVNSKHTKSEAFSCPHCSYVSYEKGNLLKHVNAKHTKSEIFDCPHCSYKTHRKWVLLRHVNSQHTKTEVFDCLHCSYKAYKKSNLLKHLRSRHKDLIHV